MFDAIGLGEGLLQLALKACAAAGEGAGAEDLLEVVEFDAIEAVYAHCGGSFHLL